MFKREVLKEISLHSYTMLSSYILYTVKQCKRIIKHMLFFSQFFYEGGITMTLPPAPFCQEGYTIFFGIFAA